MLERALATSCVETRVCSRIPVAIPIHPLRVHLHGPLSLYMLSAGSALYHQGLASVLWHVYGVGGVLEVGESDTSRRT